MSANKVLKSLGQSCLLLCSYFSRIHCATRLIYRNKSSIFHKYNRAVCARLLQLLINGFVLYYLLFLNLRHFNSHLKTENSYWRTFLLKFHFHILRNNKAENKAYSLFESHMICLIIFKLSFSTCSKLCRRKQCMQINLVLEAANGSARCFKVIKYNFPVYNEIMDDTFGIPFFCVFS